MLGLESADGIRWDSMLQTTGRLSSRSLREALPRTGQLSVLTWPTDRPASLQAFAMREVLSAGRRGFDAVVVDLPRHHDAVIDETISRCDHVVLVSTLTVPGVSSAARVAHRLPELTPARHLVTRGQPGRGGAGVGEPPAADAAAGGDGRPARSRRGDQPRRRSGALPARRARSRSAFGCRLCCSGAQGGGRMSEVVSADLLDGVRERLARDAAPLTPQLVAQALRDQGRPVGDATVLAVHDALHRDVVGAGPLEPLLRLDGVTDVLVNGAGQVWIDRGAGLELTGIGFADDQAVRRLAQRLAATGGRRLDDASPYVDLRLPDGSRFHAVLAPVSRPGTVLSLRVPRQRVFTLAELVEAGAVSAEGAALLELVVQRRLAFLVSGGTGSGKTTLLNALLSLVGADERLVLVEDASELRPEHGHVVALEARPANIEGAGEVTLRTLVRQALRMRPDRLVVGEVRGGEVVDMLAAMNTGHEGGCATIHANSAADVPSRVEGLALAAGLTREAAHSQLCSAVDVVIHLGRGRDRTRRVREIGVVTRRRDGGIEVVPGVSFAADGSLVPGPAIDDAVRADRAVSRAVLSAGRGGGGPRRRQCSAPPAGCGRRCPSPRFAGAARCSPALVLLAVATTVLVARGRGSAPSGSSWSRCSAAVALGVGRLVRRRRAARAAEQRSDQVLAVCESMASDLAAGQPPLLSLDRAAAEWPEFAPVAVAGRMGADVPAALRELPARPGGAAAAHAGGDAGRWRTRPGPGSRPRSARRPRRSGPTGGRPGWWRPSSRLPTPPPGCWPCCPRGAAARRRGSVGTRSAS